MRFIRTVFSLTLILGLAASASAQTGVPAAATPQPGQVLASGTVPDEVTKAAVLARLREVYGDDKVVDQIAVGQVAQPANWNAYVQKLITPNLKQISRGQLKIDGSTISVRGEVANEAQRQKIASDMATSLNPTYVINNGLRVSAAEQSILDSTLANRIIEFESGQANLTASGRSILDQMAAAMRKLQGRKVEIIGHTDNQGLKVSNQNLSQARAEAVKTYLQGKGIDPDMLTASGQGSDRPIASNDTPDGRARNRRIEFRIAQ
ncbi:cell envelope biogenesis protein OmpA [Duganella sp. Leaf126]|uniref:OmpA family protein n=1 Tax=Duganella sp. Leaf126 TaxID=1736266 RepID=UPI0006FD7766|nr:OmpA family protein [Duganella sp. Leaf126]KQQ44371.1 cell envelope biogenesis protein OmpA [Duganella sp. Leaf126]